MAGSSPRVDINIDFERVVGDVMERLQPGLLKTAERAAEIMRGTSVFADDPEAAARMGRPMMRSTIKAGEAGENPKGAYVYAGFPSYWIETGTERMDARPFIRPAVEQAKNGVDGDVRDIV